MWRWVNREKARYYHAELTADLFGGWNVITAWGALGSRHGQMRRSWVPSYKEGLQRLAAIDRRRQQRGYDPIASP
jgi:hypothetical protein